MFNGPASRTAFPADRTIFALPLSPSKHPDNSDDGVDTATRSWSQSSNRDGANVATGCQMVVHPLVLWPWGPALRAVGTEVPWSVPTSRITAPFGTSIGLPDWANAWSVMSTHVHAAGAARVCPYVWWGMPLMGARHVSQARLDDPEVVI
jgi:hypothetical protein